MEVLIVSLILLIGAVALTFLLLFCFPVVMIRCISGVTVFLVDAVLWVWFFPRLIVGRIRKLRQKRTATPKSGA